MRLTQKEFVLQFPKHPVSVELIKSKAVMLTGKEKTGVVVAFKQSAAAKKHARKNANSRKKKTVKAAKSPLEALFSLHIKAEKMDKNCEQEYAFEPTRRWRMDFAWPSEKVAVEVEGGVWTQGRHTRPQGFINDTEKYNHATLNGWAVLRFTEQSIKDGTAIAHTKQLLTSRRAQQGESIDSGR